MLLGHSSGTALRPGQVRVIVASFHAPFGPPLDDTDLVEVTLTLDAGAEDVAVRERDGLAGLRRGRILRLVDEALEQGGVLTHEDLAKVLNVDTRTIRRDVRSLKAAGHLLHTRGPLKGVGRGQTHKVRIIALWLDRESYDRMARWVHHTPQAIQRYVDTFLRIVMLRRTGTPVEEIAFLTHSSVKLVNDYLAVYEAARQQPARAQKLAEELARVSGGSGSNGCAEKPQKQGKKGGQTR
ncbi:MAG: DUF1670 domain-containing protein [Chloroflexi bacterium]|nr:DUF1670 domain-containing protein [Chloroflexota bacterium]